MSNNPYAIQAGEKLSPDQVLRRYLDWSNYNQSYMLWKYDDTCDAKLYTAYLCCPKHRQVSNDRLAFFDYFYLLGMLGLNTRVLSDKLLIEIIKRFEINVDRFFLRKLFVYWNVDNAEGLDKLKREGVKIS